MFGDNNGCAGKLVGNFECMGKDSEKDRLSSSGPCGSETKPEKYLNFSLSRVDGLKYLVGPAKSKCFYTVICCGLNGNIRAILPVLVCFPC